MNALEAKVQFIEYHQPPLDSGIYQVKLEQTIKTIENSTKISEQKFSTILDFAVTGHRFAPLAEDEIHAIFPPSDNLGEYSNALPHITLKRSTLPWERSCVRGDSKLPWLALLLFREDEKPTPSIIALKDIQNGIGEFPTVDYEPGQTKDDELTVIDVPKKRLEQILPSIADMALLASVSNVTDGKGNLLSEPLATIVCNRLPRPGEVHTVHLVSLENRYHNNGQYIGRFNYQGARNSEFIRLVSLTSWSFSCIDSRHNFAALLKNLDRDPDILSLPTRDKGETEPYLKSGYVPLSHGLRQGAKTVSWYHSPLAAGKSPDRLTAPVVAADELTRYDRTNGLFDISYAAAWELGKLLTLQAGTIAVDLFNWKRSQAHILHQLQQQVLHLPFQGEGESPLTNAIPDAIAEWFRDLELLKPIPFHYLVPDEGLLPPESLRFFWIDSYWVDCLQDGAFSVGRVTAADVRTDMRSRSSLSTRGVDEWITGFLLHSEVVSGWPDLEVEGYSDRIADENVVDPNKKLTILRKEQLSEQILLCLFKGEVKTIDLSLKPEAVNCGVDPIPTGSNPPDIEKGLRKLDGTQSDERVTVPFRSLDSGVIAITALANKIKKGLNLSENITSAQFALTMIEGAEKIRFSQK